MLRSGLFAAFVLLAATACGGRSPVAADASAHTSAPTPSRTPSAVARYRITFDASWSAETHPNDIPRTPHFSGLIGGTHNSRARFWLEGALASEGIRLMAEQGRKTRLDAEVAAAVAEGRAQQVLSGGDVPLSPGTVSLDFDITRDRPLVTLVSMVAPSPDWFVGVSGLGLIENGS